jgi:hypothetical protein
MVLPKMDLIILNLMLMPHKFDINASNLMLMPKKLVIEVITIFFFLNHVLHKTKKRPKKPTKKTPTFSLIK